jgi:hypothetical protein
MYGDDITWYGEVAGTKSSCVNARLRFGNSPRYRGQHREAQETYEPILDVQGREFGAENPDALHAMEGLHTYQ